MGLGCGNPCQSHTHFVSHTILFFCWCNSCTTRVIKPIKECINRSNPHFVLFVPPEYSSQRNPPKHCSSCWRMSSSEGSFLSARAAPALAPSLSYWPAFFKAQAGGLWYGSAAAAAAAAPSEAAADCCCVLFNPHTRVTTSSLLIYSPNKSLCRTPDDPEGYISMVIAENRLSCDLVQAGLNKYATEWPASMLHYQDARGIPELRSACAHMLQRTLAQVWLGDT